MPNCKNCKAFEMVKSGKSRGKQRYKCKICGTHFVEGDARVRGELAIKKALSVILYSLGKASFGFIAKLFGVSRTTAYNWVKQAGENVDYPGISGDLKEIEFDEMWHFIRSKKTKNGSSRPWIVALGEPLPGLSVTVMLQRLGGSTIKSNT